MTHHITNTSHVYYVYAADTTQGGRIHVHDLSSLENMVSMPDFSYLMILELKDFYNAKFTAHKKCMQSCEELCDCAYQLFEDMQPALRSITTHAQSIKDLFTEKTEFLISSFCGNIHLEEQYIAEELFGLGNNIYLLYHNMTPSIDLTRFKKRLQTSSVR